MPPIRRTTPRIAESRSRCTRLNPPKNKAPLFALRTAPSAPVARLVGLGAVGVTLLLWWGLTYGATPETRIISPVVLPSPIEVIRSFPSLWSERALLDSVLATLRRVLAGFAL